FYTCRPTAYDHNIPVTVVTAFSFDNQFFEGEKYMVSYGDGFLRILHAEGQFFHLRISKEVGFAACGDHQFIVRKFGIFGNDLILFRYDALHLGHPVLDIPCTLENLPERKRNITGLNPSACYLIEKRLKHVMIYLINHKHFFVLIVKRPGKLKACKPTADDYNFLPCFHSIKLLLIFCTACSHTIKCMTDSVRIIFNGTNIIPYTNQNK